MKEIFRPERLARDDRFTWVPQEQRMNDHRQGGGQASSGNYQRTGRMHPSEPGGPDRARSLMHGIFMGELQALEGAGRTCHDFETPAEAPFALKMDMARQCWDETRHCEISVKLADYMGTAIGEFAESRFLYEAACNPDPVMRLTAVNRGIEGLAIDVFSNMRQFATEAGDPVLGFSEDWMLADEVTHVKMGSDWLRRMTEDDPERRERCLKFQRVVDKLFAGAGRGEGRDLARQFRRMAGFTDDEIEDMQQGFERGEGRQARDAVLAAHSDGSGDADAAEAAAGD